MKIREFRPGDEDALNRLKLRAFETGMDRMRVDFWQWQYARNPAGSGSGVVALEGDEVVGFVGIVPKRLMVGDRIVRAAQFVDWMVDPRIRGMGAGITLYMQNNLLAEEKGFQMSFAVANKYSHKLATSKKGGFRDVFQVSYLVKPLTELSIPEEFSSSGFRRRAAQAASRCAGLISSCFPVPRTPDRFQEKEVTAIDPRYDTLWQAASREVPVAFVRDSMYLAWRYLDHPVYPYRIIHLEENGKLLGWVVLNRRSLGGLQVGEIVDWLVAPGTPQALPILLGAALRRAREAGAQAIVVRALRTQRDCRALRRQGYFPVPDRLTPFPSHFIVRVIDNGLETVLHDPDKWFWTCGDNDAG